MRSPDFIFDIVHFDDFFPGRSGFLYEAYEEAIDEKNLVGGLVGYTVGSIGSFYPRFGSAVVLVKLETRK